MNDIFNGVAAPWMQSAEKELEKERGRELYIPRAAIDLATTADSEPWIPSSTILRQVPNFSQIKIELAGKAGVRFKEIHLNLKKQKNIGLVVMGADISRNSKPAAIILLTKSVYYLLDPSDLEGCMSFLDIKITDPELQFYTTNGLKENDCLFGNYKIDLGSHNVVCATGMHIHLMKVMRSKTNTALGMYPILAAQKCKRRIEIESFEEMVETWLDISRHEFYFEKSKLQHLKTRPLDLTALNIIKKRCVLVLSLCRALKDYSWKELYSMNEHNFNRLQICDEQVLKDIIKYMEDRESGKVDHARYIHLDGGYLDLPNR